jgi:hypothetical protein
MLGLKRGSFGLTGNFALGLIPMQFVPAMRFALLKPDLIRALADALFKFSIADHGLSSCLHSTRLGNARFLDGY